MQEEFLLENSWIYQQYIGKGIEQGIGKGIEQGIEQGRVQGIAQGVQAVQQNIETTIETRFPALLGLAKSRIESLTDLAKLQEIFVTALTAPSLEVVKRSLLALP